MKQLTFLVDFDGTCVTHDFPRVGKNIGAGPVLRALAAAGHRIILWTVRSHLPSHEWSSSEIKARSGEYLNDAIQWFADNNIPLYKVNEVPDGQGAWSDSPKPHADYIIDDLMIGDCITFDSNSKRMINWIMIMKYFIYQKHTFFAEPTEDYLDNLKQDVRLDCKKLTNTI